MKKVFITESEKIKIRKMYGLVSEGKLSSVKFDYSKKTCEVCQSVKQNLYFFEEGAFELQAFLLDVGHNISNDGTFGNETAAALGTFLYGYNAKINTPRKVAEQMKKDGWNLGPITDTPYGRQMAKEVGSLLKMVCENVSKVCNKQKEQQEKLKNPTRIKWSTDRKNFNPQTNSYFGDLKKRCETFLNQKIPIVKQKFVNWVNSPKTLKKLNPLPIQIGLENNLPIENLKKVVYSIDKKIYNCQGPFESEHLFKSKRILGFYSPITNNITLNYEASFSENELEKAYSTLIHETTHWIEGNLPVGYRQTINRRDKVKSVYPLSVKDKWESEFFDNQSFNKVSISDVPQKSISEFNQIGISTALIQSFIEAWNLELTSSINDKNGLKEIKYYCGRDEKEANLKSVRELYTGTLENELTTKNLKDIMNQKYDNTNEYSFLICWAGNAFIPSPFEFLKLSNQLAVNEKPTDDTNIQNNQPLNLDFSDIDPMA